MRIVNSPFVSSIAARPLVREATLAAGSGRMAELHRGAFLASRFCAAASGRRKVWARFLAGCKWQIVDMALSTGFGGNRKSLKYRESRATRGGQEKIFLMRKAVSPKSRTSIGATSGATLY